MRDPETIVKEFCAAWGRRDIAELLGYFADDAIYHNMPVAPATGKDAIGELLRLFVPPAERIDFEVLHVASRGAVVFTERIDRFRMGGREVVIPAAGVFEVRDGKIAAWRDYFDFATWQRQTE